jgi:hypothetical protein
MSIIRVGSTSSYAEGWEAIFGASGVKTSGKGEAKKASRKPAAKKPAQKKTAKKKAAAKARHR